MQKTRLIYDGFVVVGEHSTKQIKGGVPSGTQLIIMISMEGDKETIGHYKAKLDEIAKKNGGTMIGPGPAKLPTYDLIGEHATKVRSYGVSGPINGFIPTYKLPKVATEVDQMLMKHEDLLLTQPETGLKSWLNAAFIMKGPVVNYACRPSFVSDPPEKREQAVDFWHELVKYIANQGSCPYWIGKAWTPYLTPLYRKEYYALFKALKQNVDPNMILNQGLFLFR
jgi:FAD/FMN-containing dehydrogenase